jgi:hypothetical protein
MSTKASVSDSDPSVVYWEPDIYFMDEHRMACAAPADFSSSRLPLDLNHYSKSFEHGSWLHHFTSLSQTMYSGDDNNANCLTPGFGLTLRIL